MKRRPNWPAWMVAASVGCVLVGAVYIFGAPAAPPPPATK